MPSISAAPGETVRVGYDAHVSGLAGTMRVRVMQGATQILAPTTVGIVEIVAGSGSYEATFLAPGTPGRYRVLFDHGAVGPTTCGSDDLEVTTEAGTVSQTVTLGPDIRLPVGTTVSVYADNEAPAGRGGTPVGTALSSTTVGSDSKFTFSGLTHGDPYQVYALVAGKNVWTTFTA